MIPPSPRARLALATFLCLVPVTLLVPGLHELVVVAHGGTDGDAHAFMTVNMLAGMITVPLVMRALRRHPGAVRRWAMAALLVDAAAFVGMAFAPGLAALYAFRVVDGAVHLPAITLLMVASNRSSGEGRGRSLGALATAIMIGVAIGSPLGGRLVEIGVRTTYLTGAALLVLAAVVVRLTPMPLGEMATGSRYAWRRSALATWIPLAYGFLDRFSIGIYVSTFTLYLTNVIGLSAPQRGALVALFMVPFALLCYPAGRLADRVGWFAPLLIGNVLFGLTFGSYGLVSAAWLPYLMLASGVFSALMFAPNLVLISELASRGHGEGLFGAFQVAGSLGFLTGPIVGGLLVTFTRGADGVPAYRAIFLAVGMLAAALSLVSWVVLRRLAQALAREAPPAIPVSLPTR